MSKTKKLTKKQEKLIINSIVFQIINAFDILAFEETDSIDEDTKIELSEKIRLVAEKFKTDFINIGNTDKLLKAILSENKVNK